MEKQLSLIEYIETFHDWYYIDKSNQEILKILDAYCRRDKAVEKMKRPNVVLKEQTHISVDRGILLYGDIGSGKTELLWMINKFFSYTQRKTMLFRETRVPAYADQFSIDGRAALGKYKSGNWMFDELCFMDEVASTPHSELVMNFGEKMFVGGRIIDDRYDAFREGGWKTYFTTNATLKNLEKIYTRRRYSRLLEMCNIIFLPGTDRRIMNNAPRFKTDFTSEAVQRIAPPEPVVTAPVTISAEEEQRSLQLSYQSFLHTGNWMFIHEGEYERLKVFYKLPDLEEFLVTERANDPKSPEDYIAAMARKRALAQFYSAMADANVGQLFPVKQLLAQKS